MSAIANINARDLREIRRSSRCRGFRFRKTCRDASQLDWCSTVMLDLVEAMMKSLNQFQAFIRM